MQYKLVNAKTGAELRVGERVSTGDGRQGVLEHFRAPHKPSSTGRVVVRLDGAEFQREWYPSVIGAQFKIVEAAE